MGVFFRSLWLYFALIISAILCLFQLVFLKVPLVPKVEETAATTNIYDHREVREEHFLKMELSQQMNCLYF
jgi:hypothetical protein